MRAPGEVRSDAREKVLVSLPQIREASPSGRPRDIGAVRRWIDRREREQSQRSHANEVQQHGERRGGAADAE